MGAHHTAELAAISSLPYRDRPWTWAEVVADPWLAKNRLQVELNKYGQLIMSPAAHWQHSRLQFALANFLNSLDKGYAAGELAITTPEGTFEPDVVWAPKAYWDGLDASRPDVLTAPALVVEVLSPSNTEAEMMMKKAAYFAAGASEVWLLSRQLELRFYQPSGQVLHSGLLALRVDQVVSQLKI
jgi:Uma2 family endonuclease